MQPHESIQAKRFSVRLFVITISAIFMAEVVAMIVVYLLAPRPYPVAVLVDAGIMTGLIFPVLYYFSFRPLLRQMEKSREAEESLLRSRELQEKFFDSIDTLIAYMDRDFNFVQVNDAYARYVGQSPAFFPGKNHFELYPHAENQTIFERVAASGEGFVVNEKPFEYPEQPELGVTYWNWSLQPVKGRDGAVEGLVLSLVDVTERKRAEDKLQHAYDELELRVQRRTEELRLVNAELQEEIAERKRVEEALRRGEALLLETGKMAHVGGWDLDLRTNELRWSLETYRIHEVDFSVAPDVEKAIQFYTPEARPLIREAVQRLIDEGAPYDLELPIVTARGMPLWIRTMGQSEIQDGKAVRLFGTFQDITQRRQAAEQLRLAHDELEVRVRERTEELAVANQELRKEIAEREQVERKLRTQTTAMEAAANGIVMTDRHGNIQWMNPAFLQICGYEAEDLLGQNMHIFRSGMHGAEYYGQMWDTILSGQVWKGEIVNRRKDGRLYTEDQTITPVRDDRGQVIQFIAIKQDVTERKQAEVALRASEEKFRTLVEWTYDWELWLDPEGNVVYNSPSCERITGYRQDEFQAAPELMLRIVHPQDVALYQSHQELLHDVSADVETIEYRILTRDGRERWIKHICRPLFGGDRHYLGRRMSNRDITEQKQAERDIQERNHKEQTLTKTIHTMQLDIARDLHDTLGQNISFLRMKLDHLTQKKIRKQSEMQLEIRSMSQAADESYDLMRGTLAVLQSETSADLFRLFTHYAEQIEERSGFSTTFSTRGEPRFMSATRMRQLFYIFRETLNNIEKHSNATEVSIEMAWGQECLNLDVFDNGNGFDPDVTRYGGHYGLRFMRERAELLNGSLNIQSDLGSGTHIALEVPYQ